MSQILSIKFSYLGRNYSYDDQMIVILNRILVVIVSYDRTVIIKVSYNMNWDNRNIMAFKIVWITVLRYVP